MDWKHLLWIVPLAVLVGWYIGTATGYAVGHYDGVENVLRILNESNYLTPM